MSHRGSGGTEGGVGLFAIGFVLSIASVYFFFHSVQITGGGSGLFARMLQAGQTGGGWYSTASTGLVMVPFLLGVIALFYDAKKVWAWILMWTGLAILAIEILSSLSFSFSFRASYMLLLLVLFGAGVAMMLRSYKSLPSDGDLKEDGTSEKK
jgi:hypothetical protein